MKKQLAEKLHSQGGINRLVLILLVLVLALAVAILIPVFRSYAQRADEIGCTVALKKAQDMLNVEYLTRISLSYDDAVAVVERSKWEADALCPAGGDYYLLEQSGDKYFYRVVCGLHESDTRLRTRLNASHVYTLLEEALQERADRGLAPPDDGFVFTVNSQSLEVKRLEGNNGLRWGTDYTIDFDGIVCFFALSADGDISWFVYADGNHAAVWRQSDGWSGDAYPED